LFLNKIPSSRVIILADAGHFISINALFSIKLSENALKNYTFSLFVQVLSKILLWPFLHEQFRI